MEPAVIVVGAVAEALAWAIVVRGRRDIWRTLLPVLGLMGAAALVTGSVRTSPRVALAAAVAAGVTAGGVLYVATRVFVHAIRGWAAFQRQSIDTYERQGNISLSVALALSVGVSALGEELFWRGLVQPELSRAVDGRVLGAALSYLAFVAVNLPSANLAILAGAVVGGAVWTILGWWSGGFLASVCCHGAWTALMLAFPVVRRDGDRLGP
jgi:membrane protease YdiL (CAAX protease family)